jgi:hypothetical protein
LLSRSDTEARVREAIVAGDPVDLRTDDEKMSDGQSRGRDALRPLDARMLEGVLRRSDWPQPPIRLWLRRVCITGRLDLDAVELAYPVILLRCWFEDDIRLTDASLPALTLTRCRLRGLDAAQVNIRGDLKLPRTLSSGAVRLRGARIGGNLVLNRAWLTSSGGPALSAERVHVEQDMVCSGLHTRGAVNLNGAQIGGRLDLSKAKLCNPERVALGADGLTVGHHMQCAEIHVKGATWLMGARIGGNLEFEDATLIKSPRPPDSSDESDEYDSACSPTTSMSSRTSTSGTGFARGGSSGSATPGSAAPLKCRGPG